MIYECEERQRKRTVLSRRRNELLRRLNLLEDSLNKPELDSGVEKCLLDQLAWNYWPLSEVKRALSGRFDIVIIADA